MPRTKPTTRKTVAVQEPETVPLDIPLPGGGRALFHRPADLPPAATRDLDILMTVHGRRMDDIQNGTGAPVTKDEAADFMVMNDLAAFAYWREWRGSDGRKRDMPDSVEDMLTTVPTPIYRAVVQHAAKLVVASLNDSRFSFEALGDDIDEADEDLPTSA